MTTLPPQLHVDNSGQLLDSVEQQVALLDGFLVLPVFAIRSEKKGNDLECCLLSYLWNFKGVKNHNITYWFPQSHSLYQFYSGGGQQL